MVRLAIHLLPHQRPLHALTRLSPSRPPQPKAFPQSRTLSLHLHHPSASNPSELVWEQVQEYTIRAIGTKKVVHSLVVVQLDENDMVVKFEDRWDAKELPTRYGSSVSHLSGRLWSISSSLLT